MEKTPSSEKKRKVEKEISTQKGEKNNYLPIKMSGPCKYKKWNTLHDYILHLRIKVFLQILSLFKAVFFAKANVGIYWHFHQFLFVTKLALSDRCCFLIQKTQTELISVHLYKPKASIKIQMIFWNIKCEKKLL